jgi:hypothetical protein
MAITHSIRNSPLLITFLHCTHKHQLSDFFNTYIRRQNSIPGLNECYGDITPMTRTIQLLVVCSSASLALTA